MKLFSKIILFSILLGFSVAFAKKQRYDGYRLIKIMPTNEEHIHLLDEWEDDPSFDVWNRIRGINHGVDVALSPNAYENYKTLFKYYGITYTILNDNIQKRIDEEEVSMFLNRLKNGGNQRVSGRYVSHAELNSWLEMIAAANPTYLTTSNIGTTKEGRTLKTLIFRKGNPSKKIWIDCGIHAREWVSPATCTYIINALITGNNNNTADVVAILNNFEIHFLPVLNPDGYEYSRTTSRLWRKNRASTSSSLCPGVDLNRNFGYQWMVAGASSNPCSDTYAGASADSEPETKAVEAVLNSQKGKWAAYISFHSYGQWFFTPWGWTTQLPPDYTAQKKLADSTASVIQSVHGRKYTTGSSAVLLYLAAGNSADWAYGNGIKYSYTIELRPADNTPDASFGFQLPETNAPAVGEENYQGFVHLAKELINL